MPSTEATRRHLRQPEILIPFAATLLMAFAHWEYNANDWLIARTAGQELLTGNLRLYAEMPEAQMGPLALLASGLLSSDWYRGVALALFLPTAVAARAWATPSTSLSRVYFGILVGLTGVAWVFNALFGHMDEALVLVAMSILVHTVRNRHSGTTLLLVVVAIAAKPTALLLLPLAVFASWRTGVAALAGGIAVYLPFFLADPNGLLEAGSGFNQVFPASLHDFLGFEVGSAYPRWTRPIQLLGGWALIWMFAARRHNVAAGLAMAWALKAMLEPGPFGSYSTPILVCALLITPSINTLVAGGAAWISFAAGWGGWATTPAQGSVRLLGLAVAAIAIVVGARRADHRVYWPPVTRSAEFTPNQALDKSRCP